MNRTARSGHVESITAKTMGFGWRAGEQRCHRDGRDAGADGGSEERGGSPRREAREAAEGKRRDGIGAQAIEYDEHDSANAWPVVHEVPGERGMTSARDGTWTP